jgi:DNA-binding phage protein
MGRAPNYPYLEREDVISLLRAAVEQAGGQAPWARKAGLERSHLNRTLREIKPIGRKVLRALKLRIVYVPDTTSSLALKPDRPIAGRKRI